jgi:glycosyltransferase involved in cell wall biosynthesis
LLVEPENPEQLSRALLRVWNDGDLARAMGRAGRERVEKHFDIRKMVSGYESLYEEVLGSTMAVAA